MASETEPDSTSIAEKTVAASPLIVRLQGGGLRFLDAHEIPQLDFNVVTRPFQNNNTQHWKLTNVGGKVHTIQQVSNGRFLDAHEISSLKFRGHAPATEQRHPALASLGLRRWLLPDSAGE